MTKPALIGDIGGTNARFALAGRKNTEFTHEKVYACRDFATPQEAIRRYLQETGTPDPEFITLAIAGPLEGNTVVFTNNNWSLSRTQLQTEFKTDNVNLLNDFEAIAYALPMLRDTDVLQVGASSTPNLKQPDFCAAVVGPGTGLGAALLIAIAGKHRAIATEGGHVGFAAETPDQVRLLTRLQSRFGRVSTERLISGSGLSNLYWALTDDNAQALPPTPAEIFARTETDPSAKEAVNRFYEILGQVAGDIVLATGAFDGIFLAGGIAQRYPHMLINSAFRNGFENKGRHSALMASVPSALILHPQPGLLGAKATLNQLGDEAKRPQS